MTIAELKALHARRTAALEGLNARHPRETLGTMDAAERARVDAASREFRECDAAIVAELRRRPGPVRLGDVTLWLTGDATNYAVCNPATGRPIHGDRRSGVCLYDYARGKAGAGRTVPA